MIRRLALAVLLAALAACSSFGPAAVHGLEDVPAAIERSQQDFDAGRTALALQRVRNARDVGGLLADQRDQLDLLIERFANRRIEELSKPGSDPSELADLADIDLPQQLSVTAGLNAARLYMAVDKPFKAYRLLKKLETQYPRHHGRAEAGAILVDAGLELADDPSGWWLWQARDDGIEVLEYLVLTYPSEPRCDLAFHKLAQMYEEDRDYELAIQRCEELVLSHIDSPLVIEAQARIPHLRLLALESPEYDRKELLRTRKELEAWLRAHAGHELEQQVQIDYADCLHRVARSDLGIARFYHRIDQPYGARFHAQRAADLAHTTGDAELIAECEALLAELPAVPELPGRVAEDQFRADPTEIRTTVEQHVPPEAAVEKPKEPQP